MSADSIAKAAPAFEPVTQFDLHQRMAETPGVAVLLLSAPACGSCRAMRAALAELARARPGLQLFEADAGREAGIVQEFEVFHLPALFVWRDGEYHGALQAGPLPSRLAEALDALLAAPPQEAP